MLVALLLKDNSNVPALLVVTVPITVPPTVRSAPSVKAPDVLLNTSSLLAPPFLAKVRVAPS